MESCSIERDGSCPGADHPGDRLGQCRFARPVGAEDGHGLTIAHLEVDPLEGKLPGVTHLEPGYGEHQSAPSAEPSPDGASGAGGNGSTPRRNAACTRVSAATSSGSPSPTTVPVSST